MSSHDDGILKDRYFDYENDDAAKAAEAEIVAGLGDKLFEDPAFPCSGTSLYKNPNAPPRGSLPPDAVEWNRINELEIVGCENPSTFIDGTSAGDVIQGSLGDCWYISALSVLGTREDLLKSTIVSDENRSKGIYTVKISKAGKWRYVHIDDRIPCNRVGKVNFAHSRDPNETWVMILEKAYAKLHGSYQAIVSGYIDFGLRDLTGAATIKMKFSNKKVKKLIQRGELWEKLKVWKAEGSLMGCSLSGGGTEHDTGMGILAGHAYGILRLEEVSAEETEDIDAFEGKMIQIRNPWGQGEWKGDWCDDDVMWEDYPAIQDKLAPDGFKQDGTFWMEWEDFKDQFNQLFLCLDFDDSWQGRRYRGKWVPGDKVNGSGGMPKYPTFPTNPQYSFTVEEETQGVFIVSQKDNRWQGGESKYKTAVGWVCMKLDGDRKRCPKFSGKKMAGMSRTFASSRSVAGEITLKPGRYAVIPTTFKPQQNEAQFVLEMYTSKNVQYDLEGDELPDLDDIELAAVEDDNGDDDDVDDDTFAEDSEEEEEPEEEGRELTALSEQVGDLAEKIRSLAADVQGLEAKVVALEGN